MPHNDSSVSDRHVEEPTLFTDVHRSATSASSRDGTRVPWRPAGAVASLGAPVGIGMLHPMLGEVIGIIYVVVMLTIIVTALFGSQALVERTYRLLRWFANRPEPPSPGGETGDGASHTMPPGR